MSAGVEVSHARILIVDDQDSNLRLLQFALARGGYDSVMSTPDPRAVSELHRTNHYDLILLDIRMPEMDGFEVMNTLRRVDKDTTVGILVLTADPSQMTRALAEGANGFLTKPFVLAEVLRRVGELLAGAAPPVVREITLSP
jgi:CheY-like chemotaxis protein